MYCQDLRNHFVWLANESRSPERPMTLCVCANKKLIMMKPGKTAGSSVFRGALQDQLNLSFIFKTSELNEWLSKTNDEYLGKFHIFSLIRNPYDRFASCAKYFDMEFNNFCNIFSKDFYNNFCVPAEITVGESRKSDLKSDRANDFADYLNIQSNDEVKKYVLKREHIISHMTCLYHYNYVKNRKFTDQIIRMEQLQNGFNELCDKIKVRKVNLERRQVSNNDNKHYSKYYNDETKSLVSRIFDIDIKTFNYKFENVNI